MTPPGKKILTSDKVHRAVEKIAQEIHHHVQKFPGDWALVGIQRRGVPLAQRLAQRLSALGGPPVPVGRLDITFYRDDMHETSEHPVVHDTDLPFDVNGKTIFLVDDVLFTGRTIRSALDQLMDFGRPKRVRLAVLVDRGHRELPIQADFVGELVATAVKDIVEVRLQELDGEDAVLLTSGKKSTAREVS